MRRVEADGDWSCSIPSDVPELPDLYGEAFERGLRGGRGAGLVAKTVKARDLYARMMRTLAQTGNGWMTFKDKSQPRCATRPALPGRTVHLSNLCTEILEVNIARRDGGVQPRLDQPRRARSARTATFDWEKLRGTVRTAVVLPRPGHRHQLLPDRSRRRASNPRWRPVGLGLMGLQDVFFTLRLPFDSPAARELSTRDRRRRST